MTDNTSFPLRLRAAVARARAASRLLAVPVTLRADGGRFRLSLNYQATPIRLRVLLISAENLPDDFS